MRLENLYLNFGKSSPEDQQAYIAAYRLRRAEDLEKPSTYIKKVATVGAVNRSKIDLSESEKMLISMLGLKPKDIIALRAASIVEPSENSTEPEDLFIETDEEEEE